MPNDKCRMPKRALQAFDIRHLSLTVLAQWRGPRALTERDPAIFPALDRAVRRALDLAPEERSATPQAFASDVLQALATV
jgi:hypothetical protein